MIHALCFGFLVLMSNQILLGSSTPETSDIVHGDLFGKWCRDGVYTATRPNEVKSCLVLDSAPLKHALVCTSGFMSGVAVAMGITSSPPLMLLAAVPLLVSRYIINKRVLELRKRFYDFNEKGTPFNLLEKLDLTSILKKTALQSLILPAFVGIAGVVLYNFAPRYQIELTH